jgi:hypothetical protein
MSVAAIAGGTTVLTMLLMALFQRQLRGYRFARVERRFVAAWSRLSVPDKRAALARAFDARLLARPGAVASELDRLMMFALGERWRAMRLAGDYDFERLNDDLRRVLGSAALA